MERIQVEIDGFLFIVEAISRSILIGWSDVFYCAYVWSQTIADYWCGKPTFWGALQWRELKHYSEVYKW